MNRGEIKLTVNFADHSTIDVNCFVNVVDPNDKEEIIDVIMGAFDVVVEDNNDTQLLNGVAKIEFFEGLLIYRISFEDVMEKGRWDWSKETLH